MFIASLAITITLLYIVFASSHRIEKAKIERLRALGRDDCGRFTKKTKRSPRARHYVKCFYMGKEQKGFYLYD